MLISGDTGRPVSRARNYVHVVARHAAMRRLVVYTVIGRTTEPHYSATELSQARKQCACWSSAVQVNHLYTSRFVRGFFCDGNNDCFEWSSRLKLIGDWVARRYFNGTTCTWERRLSAVQGAVSAADVISQVPTTTIKVLYNLYVLRVVILRINLPK